MVWCCDRVETGPCDVFRYQDSCSFENPTHLSRKTKNSVTCSAKFKHYIEHSADSK